jgi:hypothetical protein
MRVADNTPSPANETLLVAEVRVHLDDGESFELLPFVDAKDVKSKVSDLLEEWSKSGFLVRGSQIIPWHCVRRVEALRVESLSPAAAERRLTEWATRDQRQYQQSFWKTKEPREKKKKNEDEESGAQPHAA